MKSLSGKKTYFTAAAAVITALGGYFAGEVDITVTIQSCFAALMMIFLRAGVTSESKKTLGSSEGKSEEVGIGTEK